MMNLVQTKHRLSELQELLAVELASDCRSTNYVDDLMLSIGYCENDIKSMEFGQSNANTPTQIIDNAMVRQKGVRKL